MDQRRTSGVNKKESEWEDVTDEWEDINSSQSAPTEPTNTPEQPWYVNAFDFLKNAGTGLAKGAGTVATTPSRLLTDLGVPGYKNQDYGYLQPKGKTQDFFSGLAEAVPYIAGGAGEAALASKLPAMGRGMATLGKAAIGAAGGAASNYATGESPTAGALWGGGTPLVSGLFSKPLSYVGNKLRQSGIYSMGKAIGANYLNRGRDYVEKQIIQPLLDRGIMFSSLRNLEDKMKSSASQALAVRDAIRAQKPADYSIPYGEVEDALGRAKERFRTIVDPATGITMPSGSRDISKINYIDEELSPNIQKSLLPAPVRQAFGDYRLNDIQGNTGIGRTPPARTDPVLFDILEDFKQDWAGFARQHGKYQGKKMVGQIPESTVEVEAKFEAANEMRKLLKDKMPKEWDEYNRKFHVDQQIADLAEQRDLARMGQPASMSETALGEVPSAYPGRAISRTYMKIIHSPAWNSSLAQLKEKIGKKLVSANGLKSGQAFAFLDSLLRGPSEFKVTTVDNPDETYDPASEDLTPFMAPDQKKRIRWNQESQTFE